MSGSLYQEVSIVFVLGGPGAGKGTQCARPAQQFHIRHLSIGDVLRAERDRPGAQYGKLIARNMEEGKIGPVEVTVKLLEMAMQADVASNDTKLFLIDGRSPEFYKPTYRARCFNWNHEADFVLIA